MFDGMEMAEPARQEASEDFADFASATPEPEVDPEPVADPEPQPEPMVDLEAEFEPEPEPDVENQELEDGFDDPFAAPIENMRMSVSHDDTPSMVPVATTEEDAEVEESTAEGKTAEEEDADKRGAFGDAPTREPELEVEPEPVVEEDNFGEFESTPPLPVVSEPANTKDDGFTDFATAPPPIESPAASMTPVASLDDLFGPMDNKPMSMSTEDIPSIVAVEAPTETEVDDDDGFGDFDAAPSPAPSPSPKLADLSDAPTGEEHARPVAAPEPSIDDLFGAPIEDKHLDMDMFQAPGVVTPSAPASVDDAFGEFESTPVPLETNGADDGSHPPAPAFADDTFGIFEQSTTPTPPTQATKDPFAEFASLI